MPGYLQDGLQGREAYQFRGFHRGPVLCRRGPHGFEGDRDRGLLQVLQVHRDLRPASHLQPEGFDTRQPAVAFPHRPGDGSGYAHVVGIQVSIEGHQEGTGADGHGSLARVELRWAVVRLPEGISHAGSEALVAPATDVGKVPPMKSCRGRLVEVDSETKWTYLL